MVQQAHFAGLPTEDSQVHFTNVVEIRNAFKLYNVIDEATHLLLSSFSLRDRAQSWLYSFIPGSITSWADLCTKFIFKFLPFEKMHQRCNKIQSFTQFDEESLYEAWSRFKELECKCPNHGIQGCMMIKIFYGVLSLSSCTLVYTASGGLFFQKTKDETHAIVEELAYNGEKCPLERRIMKKDRISLETELMKVLAA